MSIKRKRPVLFHPPRKQGSTAPHVIHGLFHQWGKDLEEDEQGFHEITKAVIEDKHGKMYLIDVRDVKFTDKH